MQFKKPLKIIAFFDTRPGHIKQTSGILKSLAELTSIEIKNITLEIPSLITETQNLLRFFLNIKSAAFNHLQGFDLIIGTGTHTHIPMLSCKKELNLPVITSMSPSSILINKFDLCFIPYHDNVKPRANIILTNGPPNLCRSKNKHNPDKGLILIGGIDDKSHRWNNADIIFKTNSIVSKNNHINWLISSSPRTPDKTIISLQKLAEKHKNCCFVHFKETESGWIEHQYDSCQRVWVTADSMSMVYESLSAGCQVGLLPVQWKKQNSKFIRSEQNLLKKNLVLSYKKWHINETIPMVSNSLNEAEKCATEILKRWWPNRIQ